VSQLQFQLSTAVVGLAPLSYLIALHTIDPNQPDKQHDGNPIDYHRTSSLDPYSNWQCVVPTLPNELSDWSVSWIQVESCLKKVNKEQMMEIIIAFLCTLIISVAAEVIAYYLIKWIDK
jgi:hypothetical protein